MSYYKITYFIIAFLFLGEKVFAADISGIVSIPESNVPVSEVTVVLNPIKAIARTDENGYYQFDNIPPGQYEVFISYNQVLNQKQQIVLENSNINYDISAIPGDLNKDGKINLIDAALFAGQFGATTGTNFLDFNQDQQLSEQDMNLWYDVSWQQQGHCYSYKLLDDAEHTDYHLIFPANGKWETIHDNGSSFTVPNPSTIIYPSSGGYYSDNAYKFQYKLGSAAQFPYALIRLLFGNNDNVIFDARKYKGFSVVLKGENLPLIVSLKSAVTSDDWSEYFVRIPSVSSNWQSFTFDFREQFGQPGWGSAEKIEDVLQTLQAIQFKADDSSKDQLLSLWIDNIFLIEKLYEPATANVSGKITSGQASLPAVIVNIYNAENSYKTLSDLIGEIQFSNVESGKYSLTTFRPGYRADTVNVSIEEESQVSIGNIELQQILQTPKPISKGQVRVVGRDLQVDFENDGVYESFFINGVGYSPVPIGSWGDLIYPEKVFNRDMPLLQAMNCNAIRTWGNANELLLDKAEQHGIKVLAGFWVSTSADFFSPADRLSILNEFKQYVSEYKNHPAILAWSVGNELNYVNGDNWAWYSLVEDLAVIAYQIEGEDYHPVTTPNGDRYRIGFTDFLARDVDLPYLDFWGMNIYKSDREGFAQTFLIYSAFSSKPLWISEYGIDAYDNRNHREYEVEQAKYARNRVVEMKNFPVCIGATLMAYSDEWWKAGDPNAHDFGGYPTTAHPDGYSNEEWWGIFRASKNSNDIDILTKRAIYDTLKVQFFK